MHALASRLLLASALTLGASAFTQEQSSPPAGGSPVRLAVVGEQDSLKQNIDRLTRSAALCRELGEEEAAQALDAAVERLARSLNASASAKNGQRNMLDRAVRIMVLNEAQDLLQDSGWETASAQIAALLAVSRANDSNDNQAIQDAAEALGPLPEFFPNLVWSLRAAGPLAEEAGSSAQAQAFRDLASFYIQREGLKPLPDLSDRAARVPLITEAADLYRKAGDLEAATWLDRMAKVGQLQIEGDQEQLANMDMRDMSMTRYFAYLEEAAVLAQNMGEAQKSDAIRELREFYRRRTNPAALVRTGLISEPLSALGYIGEAEEVGREALGADVELAIQEARVRELELQIARISREISDIKALLKKTR